MNLKSVIEEEVLLYVQNQGVNLTDTQVQAVVNGVEYYISESMSESISTAVSNVMDYE